MGNFRHYEYSQAPSILHHKFQREFRTINCKYIEHLLSDVRDVQDEVTISAH